MAPDATGRCKASHEVARGAAEGCEVGRTAVLGSGDDEMQTHIRNASGLGVDTRRGSEKTVGRKDTG